MDKDQQPTAGWHAYTSDSEFKHGFFITGNQKPNIGWHLSGAAREVL
jgi:hypothetical protein